MATVHKSIPDAQLHELKGAAGASEGTVPVADGAGASAWDDLAAAHVSVADSDAVFTADNVEDALAELYAETSGLTAVITDVSTAATVLIPIPYDCSVEQINFILGTAITVADASITVTRSDGAAMGSQTITQSGSAEGTTFEFTPSGNNDLTYSTHKYIKIVTDGGSTTTAPLYILVMISRS